MHFQQSRQIDQLVQATLHHTSTGPHTGEGSLPYDTGSQMSQKVVSQTAQKDIVDDVWAH